MKFEWRRDWLPLAAIAVAFAASLLLYPRLPERMPTHFNIAGQVDAYGSRLEGAFGLPVVALIIYGLLFVIPYADPKRASLLRSSDAYMLMRTAVVLFMLYMHGVILYTVLRGGTLSNGLIFAGTGAVFIVMGNYMPRMRPNWIAGIRTPWTLSSESVWRATHRLGGRIFVLGGLLMLFSSFLTERLMLVALFLTIGLIAIVPTVYSLVLFRREQRTG